MRQGVASFVKSCDTCQKTKPTNRKEFAGKVTISGLFLTWFVGFAGPLPRTNVEKQHLIVAVEQISKRPVAWRHQLICFTPLLRWNLTKKK